MNTIGDHTLQRGGSLTPSNYPDEVFELYSIPAHDRGGVDLVPGAEIGSSKQLVQPGDVLLSKIIPHIRRVRVVGSNSGHRQIASGEWIVLRTEAYDPSYLRHFLLSDGFHEQFMNTVAGVGGSLVRARPQFVKQIPAPLPPVEEQRRIAAILDQADAIRTKRRQVLAHLDALPVSAFLSRFGDPDHATSTITLGEVARLSGGRNLVADDQTQETSFRVLKISAVTSGVFRETESKWLPPGYVPPSAHLVRPGDLLMSRANTAELVGATALVGDASPNLALPDKVWRFEWQSPDTDPLFIQTLLSVPSMRRRISRLASGTGGSMKNVSKEKLMRMPLPEVLAVEQHTFADSIRSAHRSRDLVAHTLDEDDALFASLQARAFRGEV